MDNEKREIHIGFTTHANDRIRERAWEYNQVKENRTKLKPKKIKEEIVNYLQNHQDFILEVEKFKINHIGYIISITVCDAGTEENIMRSVITVTIERVIPKRTKKQKIEENKTIYIKKLFYENRKKSKNKYDSLKTY